MISPFNLMRHQLLKSSGCEIRLCTYAFPRRLDRSVSFSCFDGPYEGVSQDWFSEYPDTK